MNPTKQIFRHVLVFLGWMGIAGSLSAQTYSVGHSSITFTDPARSNRSIACEIYYPATSTGDNTPIATDRKFPSIAFGHGFLMTWDAYKNVWNALVPQGFIVAFPKTEGSASPSHGEFGSDLSFVLSALENLGKNSGSMFFDRVDTLNCVMGHSMGGGAAFLSASKSGNIDFLATLAPAETNPSAIQASANLSIPALIIAGGNDCVTPPKDHQIPLYDALKSDCKALVSIAGGSHCQMAEDNFLCNFGEATCTPKPSISRSVQHQTQFQFLLPWLRFHLLNDAAAGKRFDSLVANNTAVNVSTNCVLQPSNAIGGMGVYPVEVYPNPAEDEIHVRFSGSTQIVSCDLISMDGRLLHAWNSLSADEAEIALTIPDSMREGCYVLRIQTGDQQMHLPLMLR